MMYRVLFFQPPSPPYMDVDREAAAGFGLASPNSRSSYGHNRQPFLNLSLAGTAGVLVQQDYEVGFIDGQAERWGINEVIENICLSAPRFLITLVNLPSLKEDLNLLAQVKNNLPGISIICLGTVCKVLPQQVFHEPAIDFAIMGEPETTVVDLLNVIASGRKPNGVKGIAFKDKNGKLILNAPKELLMDLDSLPTIPYHLFPMEKYKGQYFAKGEKCMPIFSSKGCPFKCSYCHSPIGFGDRVRFRSPERVVEEIEQLYKQFKVTAFIFRDQNFTLFPNHAERICDLLIEKGMPIQWCCETRLTLAQNQRLLKKMAEAGCKRVVFGLESGDPELFEEIGKPGSRFDEIKNAVKVVKDAGIGVHMHVIVGLPGESWRSIRNTAKMLKSLNGCSFNFNLMIPFPGTPFYEEAKRQGLILTDDWSKYDGNHVVVRTEKMSKYELELARVYLSNKINGFRLHKAIPRKVGRVLKRLLTDTRLLSASKKLKNEKVLVDENKQFAPGNQS